MNIHLEITLTELSMAHLNKYAREGRQEAEGKFQITQNEMK